MDPLEPLGPPFIMTEERLALAINVLAQAKKQVEESNPAHIDHQPNNAAAAALLFKQLKKALLKNRRVYNRVLNRSLLGLRPVNSEELSVIAAIPEVKGAIKAYNSQLNRLVFEFIEQIRSLYVYSPVSIGQIFGYLPENEQSIIQDLLEENGPEGAEELLNDCTKSCELHEWAYFWRDQVNALIKKESF